jgi:hypothetical protein
MNKQELITLKDMIFRRNINLKDWKQLYALKYDLWDIHWNSMIERGYELPEADSEEWYQVVSKLKGSRGATA